jgi:sigma-B regulation protein RsbU (phosphoserine phosphatase)
VSEWGASFWAIVIDSNETLEAIIRSAGDAIVTSDARGDIITWNPAAERIFGWKEAEAVGQSLTLIIPERFQSQHHQGLARAVAAGEKRVIGTTVEVAALRKDGSEIPVELSLETWLTNGQRSFTGIIRDITERKLAEEALRNANKALAQKSEKLERLSTQLAETVDLVTASKDRMEAELNFAREIQMSLVPLTFPPFPEHGEFSIYASLSPAREVGGDFYDFYMLDENRLAFCIGGVAGKGVPSALFMAVTKTLIKSKESDEPSPANVLTQVNDELSRSNNESMFVTVFLGMLELQTGELRFSNAGHNPPYLRRANGGVVPLADRHGPVLGVVEDLVYSEGQGTLESGDLLFLYTDGVTEAISADGSLYTDQRLLDLLKESKAEGPESLVRLVFESVREFERGAEQADDVTALALLVSGAPLGDS